MNQHSFHIQSNLSQMFTKHLYEISEAQISFGRGITCSAGWVGIDVVYSAESFCKKKRKICQTKKVNRNPDLFMYLNKMGKL